MKICRSRGLCVVAVEWNPADGLTASTSNPRCDVGGDAGIEPFDDCEFPCGAPTRNAFEEMEKALTGAPVFFLKSLVVR